MQLSAHSRCLGAYSLHLMTSGQPALAHVAGPTSALAPAADYRLFAITDHNTGKTKPGMVAVVGELVCLCVRTTWTDTRAAARAQ